MYGADKSEHYKQAPYVQDVLNITVPVDTRKSPDKISISSIKLGGPDRSEVAICGVRIGYRLGLRIVHNAGQSSVTRYNSLSWIGELIDV